MWLSLLAHLTVNEYSYFESSNYFILKYMNLVFKASETFYDDKVYFKQYIQRN